MRRSKKTLLKAPPKYEIGVVHVDNVKRLWLSVTDKKLISFEKGKLITIQPYTKYVPRRGVSVEVLCDHWEISLKKLDEACSEYMNPTTSRTRPPGQRRSARPEVIGYELRFAKLLIG